MLARHLQITITIIYVDLLAPPNWWEFQEVDTILNSSLFSWSEVAQKNQVSTYRLSNRPAATNPLWQNNFPLQPRELCYKPHKLPLWWNEDTSNCSCHWRRPKLKSWNQIDYEVGNANLVRLIIFIEPFYCRDRRRSGINVAISARPDSEIA